MNARRTCSHGSGQILQIPYVAKESVSEPLVLSGSKNFLRAERRLDDLDRWVRISTTVWAPPESDAWHTTQSGRLMALLVEASRKDESIGGWWGS